MLYKNYETTVCLKIVITTKQNYKKLATSVPRNSNIYVHFSSVVWNSCGVPLKDCLMIDGFSRRRCRSGWHLSSPKLAYTGDVASICLSYCRLQVRSVPSPLDRVSYLCVVVLFGLLLLHRRFRSLRFTYFWFTIDLGFFSSQVTCSGIVVNSHTPWLRSRNQPARNQALWMNEWKQIFLNESPLKVSSVVE